MNINDLINLLESQITTLNGHKATAERLGQVERVMEIEGKILETESTLTILKGS